MRKFYEVLDCYKKVEGESILPRRATKKSCAYDFYAKTNYKCEPHKIIKIWTDVKIELEDSDVLFINVRSSQGGKFRLANTQGWIDADYFSNKNNDGNIGIFLENTTDEIIEIQKGDRIAQGMITNYYITDDDSPLSEERNGGFGSTGVK